jgi:hypothetical protein
VDGEKAQVVWVGEALKETEDEEVVGWGDEAVKGWLGRRNEAPVGFEAGVGKG